MPSLLSLALVLASSAQILVNVFNTVKTSNLVDSANVWAYLNAYHPGTNPYQEIQPSGLRYIYPPGSLVLLLPLKLIPLKSVEILISVLSLIFLTITIVCLGRLTMKKAPLSHLLILAAFFIQTFPTKFTLILGQINLIVLGLTSLSLYCYSKSKNNSYFVLSVIFFSMAAALKIFPLYILPVMFVYRDIKFVIFSLALFILLNLLPSPHLFGQYFTQVLPSLSHIGAAPPIYDGSVAALVIRFTNNPDLAKYVLFFFVFSMLILTLIRVAKSQNSFFVLLTASSFMLAAASIGNSYSWHHHLIFSFPLILVLYSQLPRLRLLFIPLWSLFFIHFKPDSPPSHINPFLASYPTLAILTLLFIQTALWFKKARKRSYSQTS